MSTDNGDDDLPPNLRARFGANAEVPDVAPEGGVVDEEGGRQNAATLLTDIALGRYKYYVNQFSDILVDVKINGVRETMTVGNIEFTEHLRCLYQDETGTVTSADMVKNAVQQIMARQRKVAKKITSALRIHRFGDEIFIDICNDKWQAIKINAAGWTVVDAVEGFRFIRTGDMRELPLPEEGGDIHEFNNLLNLDDEQGLLTVVCWLLGCLTNGPYLILSINGPDGAAKSTATVTIGNFFDPVTHSKIGAPKNIDALLAAASSCHIQRYDNMSKLPDETSDTICGMSTGIVVTKRKLYSDNELIKVPLQQPLIMNGIPNILTRGDLGSRSMPLALKSIDEKDRKTEKVLNKEFDKLWPRLLGAVLKIAVYGLNNEDKYVGKYPLKRMADAHAWCLACSDMIGGPEAIEKLFADASKNVSIGVIEGSYPSSVIFAVLEKIAAGRTSHELKVSEGVSSVEMTMAMLFDEMRQVDGEVQNKAAFWKLPGNARSLSVEVERIITAFKNAGVIVKTWPRGGRKMVKFSWTNTDWKEYALKNGF